MQHTQQKGFTLIEVILVVGILAVVASLILVAIDPGARLAEARNAQRYRELHSIADAVHRYTIENNGTLPANITGTPTEICQSE